MAEWRHMGMLKEYGDDTWGVLNALTHRNLQIAEEEGELHLMIPDEDFAFQMRRYNQLVEELLDNVRMPCEKNKELAKRLSVNHTVLSAVTSGKNARRLKRDVVLSALFSLPAIPTVDQVNHKLMELGEPGLFIETAFVEENRRNLVLHRILEFAQKEACPMRSWLDYANAVLTKLKLLPLLREEAEGTIPAGHGDMLKQWKREIGEIGFVDFSVLRRELLQAYRVRNGLDYHGGRKTAFERLSDKSAVDISMVESTFGTMSNRNSNVCPETLIPILAAMGCTLSQTNEMLLQANRALIYPASRSETDLLWIGQLVKNSQRND